MTESVLRLDESERIVAWRSERAKIAETARQQRLQDAQLEREDRLALFESDKERRIEQARQKRGAELAETEANRLHLARTRLAGLEDLTDVEDEIRRGRRRQFRVAVLRVAAFVGMPTLVVALYLSFVATPFFTATSVVSVSFDRSETADPAVAALGAQNLHRAKAYLNSPDLMAALQQKMPFVQQFSGEDTDPVRRARTIPWLGIGELAVFHRFVRAATNTEAGLLTLNVKGRTVANAEAASATIVALLAAHIQKVSAEVGLTASVAVVSLPYGDPGSVSAATSKIVFLTLVFCFLVYSIFTVFAASFTYYSGR